MGKWFNEGDDLKKHVVKAFQELLSTPRGWKPSTLGLSFERLSSSSLSPIETLYGRGSFCNSRLVQWG